MKKPPPRRPTKKKKRSAVRVNRRNASIKKYVASGKEANTGPQTFDEPPLVVALPVYDGVVSAVRANVDCFDVPRAARWLFSHGHPTVADWAMSNPRLFRQAALSFRAGNLRTYDKPR